MNKKQKLAKEVAEILPSFIKKMHRGMSEEGNIPPSQMSIVMILSERKLCTSGDLSRDMGVSAPTITGIVNRLCKSGYVKRVRGKKDLRVVNIVLTAKGNAVRQKIQASIIERWRIISKILSLKDQQMHIQILRKIIKGLDAYHAE